MTGPHEDPLAALYEPVVPADPDPAFAARLRERLTRAVLDTPGDEMTTTETPRETTTPPALSPYIVVEDARRALDWYVEVLGARQRGELYVNEDGTVGHAEIAIGDAVLMFAERSDLWPDVPVAPPSLPVHSHTLHLQVDDVDGMVDRARRRGATVEREPADQPYGRGGVIVDPFGHRWMLLRSPWRATRPRPGDVANISMLVADDQRAKAFYEAVLGIRFQPGGVPNAWSAEDSSPQLGMWSEAGREPEVQLCYRVDDIEAASARVRAAGGQAGEIDHKPYGLLVECTDDQGAHFQLWQPVD
jgi:uncharacterized glyoxalase superfamily protein PhnB